MIEQTLAMIKPDAVQKGVIGPIITMMEQAGLAVRAMKMVHLTRAQAEGFYAVHKERPFFSDLCDFMTSGPIVALMLEGEDAVSRYRALMGPTNSLEAPEGTIRQAFGTNLERNAVHGSDSPDNAQIEINYYFAPFERNGLGW